MTTNIPAAENTENTENTEIAVEAIGAPRSRLRRAMRGRLSGDRGEGVISAAIAVLIMAFLGAAMWIGFQQMWRTTESTTNDKISQIGNQ